MTAKNDKKVDEKEEKNIKVEENLGVKDDTQVILDSRGFYRIGEKWWVKIARINVRQTMAAWGVVSQAFMNVQGLPLDWNKAGTWVALFLTSLPHFPGKFYQFIMTICELQNTADETDDIFFSRERDPYAKYISRELKNEELVDIINIVFLQEKDRFVELVKKVRPLLEPMIEMWKAEQEKNQKESMQKVKEAVKIMKDLDSGPKGST